MYKWASELLGVVHRFEPEFSLADLHLNLWLNTTMLHMSEHCSDGSSAVLITLDKVNFIDVCPRCARENYGDSVINLVADKELRQALTVVLSVERIDIYNPVTISSTPADGAQQTVAELASGFLQHMHAVDQLLWERVNDVPKYQDQIDKAVANCLLTLEQLYNETFRSEPMRVLLATIAYKDYGITTDTTSVVVALGPFGSTYIKTATVGRWELTEDALNSIGYVNAVRAAYTPYDSISSVDLFEVPAWAARVLTLLAREGVHSRVYTGLTVDELETARKLRSQEPADLLHSFDAAVEAAQSLLRS